MRVAIVLGLVGMLGATATPIGAARKTKKEPAWRFEPGRERHRCDLHYDTHDAFSEKQKEATLRAKRRCEAVEEFRAFVVERQTCSNSGECTIVKTLCPFGCNVPVDTSHAHEVAAKHEELYAKVVQCVYRCSRLQHTACVNGQCVAFDEDPSPPNDTNGSPKRSRRKGDASAETPAALR